LRFFINQHQLHSPHSSESLCKVLGQKLNFLFKIKMDSSTIPFGDNGASKRGRFFHFVRVDNDVNVQDKTEKSKRQTWQEEFLSVKLKPSVNSFILLVVVLFLWSP
jgi:hypothetical protein